MPESSARQPPSAALVHEAGAARSGTSPDHDSPGTGTRIRAYPACLRHPLPAAADEKRGSAPWLRSPSPSSRLASGARGAARSQDAPDLDHLSENGDGPGLEHDWDRTPDSRDAAPLAARASGRS